MSRWKGDWLGEPPATAPPVLGAEPAAAEELVAADELPDTIYVPTERRYENAEDEVVLELRPLDDGRVAMLIFTSLDQLVHGCGENQPWVAVQANTLPTMQVYTEADLVMVDAELPHELRRTAGGVR
ncbi:hypothetical protein EV193_103448 [Herbihabitans rhizosphaerae]|uniref:SseB protein N-terminal domain-containing protein n=1 Tax=Herbihabitans rhizosphaerae TaxID=1872711 RepID=A0A4Q7KVR9_9PSEU|nr:SAV_915 family protein [Herbihabitans rhizosphaerae]RZS41129.1 hypothetical protein EV193_103448 [Herbihabitans rhizosphaerae]